MSRILIRFAGPGDARRLASDNFSSARASAGEARDERVASWFGEQQAGRRVILVAEDASGILGSVQLIFAFPPGYNDPEAANGRDIAMMESLRTRSNAPTEVLTRLVSDVAGVARKRRISTLTMCVPVDNERGVAQAKSWGFNEFRFMPEGKTLVAFFRKSIR